MLLPTGATLRGRYQIEHVVGQGGMGAVYRATDRALDGKNVAVKEMRIEGVERAQAVALFHREASMLARLQHPGLVDVTDFFEEANSAFLVMSFIDGVTLAAAAGQGPVPVESALAWMDEVCDVLAYLHGQQPPIIFRDLKPANIMLDARGRVRLIDFGIARTLDAGGRTSTALRGFLTPGYAPLEQYGESGSTDPRSDIYSLGATLYSLLTGTVPPDAVDLMTGDDRLFPLQQLRPDVSPSLEAVVRRMMALTKSGRYQTVVEARLALRASQAPATPSTPPPPAHAPGAPSPLRPPAASGVRARFCSECGAQRQDNDRWCTQCGERLDEDPQEASPDSSPDGDDDDWSIAAQPVPGASPQVPISASMPTAAPPQYSRRLHFPEKTSLGTISARASEDEPWVEVADAKSIVVIPPNRYVRLKVGRYPERLDALADLDPSDLHSLDVAGTQLKDEDLAGIVHAWGLQELEASENPIGDACLASIRELVHLKVLDLDHTRVTGEGLRHVQSCSGLRILRLAHTRVDDAGVSRLARLAALEELDLTATLVSDAAIGTIAELRSLQRLSLAGDRISDDGVVPLAVLPSLSSLDLSRTRVTLRGLARIQDLPLRSLRLADTGIGDLEVSALVGTDLLETLDLGGTRVGRVGLGSLEALPGLRILGLRGLPVSGSLSILLALSGLEDLDVAQGGVGRVDLDRIRSAQNLKKLDLSGNPVADDDLFLLSPLVALTDLRMDETRVTGKGLAALVPLQALRRLSLSGSSLETLNLPRPLPSLEHLAARSTRLGDRGLGGLRELPALRTLDLSHTEVSDAGLASVRPLARLESLDLSHTRVQGRGLDVLKDLPSLRSLDLAGNRLAGDALKHLRGLEHLERLNLSGTRIGRGMLATLPPLPRLQELDLSLNSLRPEDYRHLPLLPALKWMNLAEM